MFAGIASKAMKDKAAANVTDSSSAQQTMTINSNISKHDALGKTKIECPFNLDEIFQSDVERFSNLKDVLKFIFENLEKVNLQINTVDTKMVSKFMEISK
jgi:hypothetical protein|tara:strand:+ start:140 stop:439 length:300 start_codon:yes stop_codon:yes gene_type:complete